MGLPPKKAEEETPARQSRPTPATPVVGAAITAYREFEHLKRCLVSGRGQWDFAVVVDNGDDVETREGLHTFPRVYRIAGSPQYWWTHGTNIAIRECMRIGCDYILLVNADLELAPSCVSELIKTVAVNERCVAGSVVVDRLCPNTVYWAGGDWHRMFPALPIVINRPLFKGTSVLDLPSQPYEVNDVHGRGVLFPASVFRECAFYDEDAFPHYGADMDYAFRIRNAGYRILISPAARVRLDTHRNRNTVEADLSIRERLAKLRQLVVDPKGREGLGMLWKFFRRHMSRTEVVPTFLAAAAHKLMKTIVSH